MKAFLTGSMAYGIPHRGSDIDLVAYLSREDLDLLVEISGKNLSFWARAKALWSWLRKMFARPPKPIPLDLENPFFEIDEMIADDYPEGSDSACLRFGKLNLLCVTSPKGYNDWYDGTRILKDLAPVSREQAIEVFDALRQREENPLLPNEDFPRLYTEEDSY